ncbi:MAG TPA: hypothetical protein VK638_29000 [Edaphobacter sp.]|nr:hypothetical protein [Edaphobacter sp.]
MRDKHYEPGNSLRKDIEVCLTGAGHLYDAKTAQLEVAERFIGAELPKLVKTLTGAVAGRVVMAKTLEPAIPDALMIVDCLSWRSRTKYCLKN